MTTRPIHRLARRAAALAGTLALLSGCTSASRNAPPPAPELPAQWAGPVARQASATPDGWWRRFGDPTLDRLIDDALRTNNDLAAAAIRVYRAQLQAGLADTNLTPNVTLGATGNASRTLDTHQTRRTSGVTATLGYELDLWGKLAAQRDAARWELEATQADRDAARLALIGTTAALYWQLAYLNQQIAFGDANIAYAERTLKLVQSRHAAGATSGLDLAQAERNLAALRADQTQLIQQRTENRNALAILFGRPPQRQAAEFRLRESLANVDVTRTSFYPTFTLTGSVGTASTSLERVLQNPVATLGLGLALPFIQWNTMQLQIKVSKSQYEEAVVNFRQSLYRALGEVENALAARVQLDAEADERGRALALARRAETLAKARFAAGATGVQPWLDEQQRLRDAQSALARNQLGRLNNRMNLYQVLGGAG
ncbi:TolC family protein [Burkholderia pseudomallei]|uniref:TolC family protein n=1 Tax=Burkholderia pseudomallei TaxID=28450 RepID=UPI00050EDC84|nr:TolC family protein [Burkholderia pseudomallei]KGD10063.1 efflux transporter, outer membrane factor (OMF) lipo, NodT family protein [Burkholderia pseudomallei]